ncbi:hypothetical protein SDRG_08577 [Saprolegnia diclina VS20]|uniref:PARP-type domain-containing protein n=1 Tax=Saprolegnia diclina (strain VS20) TaxID=1156394 RepID=T0RU23_SAPDV|nr:hypothetical protein SDRG_08577 [Saprolegnia diclina VS20]EQC33897.1 hypothetical protein SDRG_08577 [Saprolegnia diclina VS20]|eukprot:XP_008612692.1 hypothetical protein SDRG_08577 [Saprolegnia diclina VS20]
MAPPSAWSQYKEAVLQVATTSTATCQACSAKISAGQLRLGVMYLHVDGFMLMEWVHVSCEPSLPAAFDTISFIETGVDPDHAKRILSWVSICKTKPSTAKEIYELETHQMSRSRKMTA